ACTTALVRAERALAGARPGDEVPYWARCFDEAQLADEFGHCHRDLQQFRAAAQHAERSLHLRAPAYARSRLFCRVVLATARLGLGELDQACQLALEAADQAAEMRSVRAVEYVRDFERRLEPYRDAGPVRADRGRGAALGERPAGRRPGTPGAGESPGGRRVPGVVGARAGLAGRCATASGAGVPVWGRPVPWAARWRARLERGPGRRGAARQPQGWGAGPGSSRAVVGGLVPCVAGARARAGRASRDGPCGWGAALGSSCVVGGPVPCVAGVRAGPGGGAADGPRGRGAARGPSRVVGGPVPCVAGARAGPAGCRATARGAGEPPGAVPGRGRPRAVRGWTAGREPGRGSGPAETGCPPGQAARGAVGSGSAVCRGRPAPRSLSRAVAARRPEYRAPCTVLVSRWSPHTYRPARSRTGRRRSCGARMAGTACGAWCTASVSQRLVDVPYRRLRCMRTAVSTWAGGVPSTVDVTSARPAGARDGSTRLTTAVWATGPPRSASRSRAVPVAGGSSVAWCTTVTGWKSGTRSPGSSS